MPGCFDNINIQDLLYCSNKENDAGVQEQEIYYAKASDVSTLDAPSLDDASEYGDAVNVSAITMVGTTGFKKICGLQNENSVDTEMVGNTGMKKIKTTLNMFIPLMNEDNAGFEAICKNMPLIFIVCTRAGKKLIVGTKRNPAYFDSNAGTTGKTQEDNSGYTAAFVSYSRLLYFTGTTIPTGTTAP